MRQSTPETDLFAHGLAQPDPAKDASASGDVLVVRSPANGEKLACLRSWAPREVEPLILAAQAQQADWAQQLAADRCRMLKDWHAQIITHRVTLAALATAESGKPMIESLAEVDYAASYVEWYAEEGRRAYGELTPTVSQGRQMLTLKVPVGVCAAITPWNFPLAMVTRKVAPALAAGCSILVKPAEATPLSALALEALAHRAGVPELIFKVVPTARPHELGRLFCEHPAIRKLSFTGSTAVGRLLMAQCAGAIKRLSLELGGNAPFLLFNDADLDKAIDGLMIAKFRNAGQTCVAANRILVHTDLHDAFLERLTERVRRWNSPCEGGGDLQIGPLINETAWHRVARLVEDAQREGARLVYSGCNGHETTGIFPPTILTDVTADMVIAGAEIFGPVAAILRFETEDEAVRLANATDYGLAAYVWTQDMARTWRLLDRLEFGMIGFNTGTISSAAAPFGGIKQSGLGREGSRHGMDEYLSLRFAVI